MLSNLKIINPHYHVKTDYLGGIGFFYVRLN